MRVVHTHKDRPTDFGPMEREWVYNGMDCCVTLEIINQILPQLDNHTAATYQFSRDLQGPTLEMRLRGVRVDAVRKAEVIEEFHQKLDFLERNLERIVLEGVGLPHFNWRSNPDKQHLFYERLGIPVIRHRGRPTVDIDALERMSADYLLARQICSHLLAMGELAKKIGVLRTGVDPDGRIRTSYNIAGTNTGRFSSSFSEFGTGGNLQNVEESLRSIFIADEGMKMAKFDAKQGESYCLGSIEWNTLQDSTYLDACETGDLHTFTSRLCEPKLPWTGDLKKDKEIAERPYYRHHSLRKLCKSIGHGSNYKGQAPTLHRLYKIDTATITMFQGKYFKAFPAHLEWWDHVNKTLRHDGYLVSLTGRKRWFFGRRNDDSTLREAIAYDPQGSLADIVNRAMLNIWHKRTATLYMHDHDALTIQYPEWLEDDVIPKILRQLEVPIELERGRTLCIPYDCKTGWNKGDWSKDNPDGLKDYVPGDKRKRTPPVHLLDRR